MVTKCARACIVSGALIGITTPASSISVTGHVRNAEVRHVEKTSRGPQKYRCPADDGVTNCADTVRETVPAPPLSYATLPRLSLVRSIPSEAHISPRRPRTPSSSRRRHLGTFSMTAYTQYHNPPQRTASGTMPAVGRTVAVDPRVIPLGTKLHIEGVGVRIAEDTGRKIKGKKLDLYLPSMRACTRFGIDSRQVYILD